MLKRMFVTGTDTAVGKTVVSKALLQALTKTGKTVVGYKPVAKSCTETEEGLRNKDALVLQEASSIPLSYQQVNPVSLQEDEISASELEINYCAMTEGLNQLSELSDMVVVEGSGGWRTLMNDMRTYSEWVVQEQLPVVLVVGIKLGCINHALLTAQAVINDGLPLVGWVANRINPGLANYAEIIQALREKIPAPQLGELPYLPRAEQRDLSAYIDLSAINQSF
ncbi:dethiobiotin synthase [Dickeya dadantii]|uniref:ATP-dependent dethiobiotin synthetase BioD n=1 Tax=Dickeya dadantii (strain 3937) TaxID=198628 RepID=E0SC05_DICD3|nr:dethiobiotin synthase [Dickeya dadantii]ADM98473.1 predicted dethiobiotin synthetase [Dickeya dadantii 3937]MCL6405456.1 ATP-dependent dethiobiotin synthetase BioD [Dickeya dadantii]NAT76063.1 ATP-dependent dethiobiotin synthetase BioD [Dickeya dadantii]NPE49939.1 ATP-dependent dethiobiotin synthetase BioD [Dickeya dadantii]NPE53677.1 ATP-dependent dethiobiotin synthetase BioD [Dickeya dadantii]